MDKPKLTQEELDAKYLVNPETSPHYPASPSELKNAASFDQMVSNVKKFEDLGMQDPMSRGIISLKEAIPVLEEINTLIKSSASKELVLSAVNRLDTSVRYVFSQSIAKYYKEQALKDRGIDESTLDPWSNPGPEEAELFGK